MTKLLNPDKYTEGVMMTPEEFAATPRKVDPAYTGKTMWDASKPIHSKNGWLFYATKYLTQVDSAISPEDRYVTMILHSSNRNTNDPNNKAHGVHLEAKHLMALAFSGRKEVQGYYGMDSPVENMLRDILSCNMMNTESKKLKDGLLSAIDSMVQKILLPDMVFTGTTAATPMKMILEDLTPDREFNTGMPDGT